MKCDWLPVDALLLIIKARLMQLVFHVSPVCVHGVDALFQREYAIAHECVEQLVHVKIQNCIRDVVANVTFIVRLKDCHTNMHLLRVSLHRKSHVSHVCVCLCVYVCRVATLASHFCYS